MKNMNDLATEVVKILDDKSGVLNTKQIRSRLSKKGFTIKDPDLVYLLDKLIKQKKVIRVDRNKYRIHYNMNPLIGKLDFTRRGSAYFLAEKGSDIFIHEGNVLNALAGDEVEIKVLNTARKKKEGKVIRIVKRANPFITVQVKEAGNRFKYEPRGTSFFPNHQLQIDLVDYTPVDGELIQLQIDDDVPGKRVNAYYIGTLGKAGDNDTEMHAIVSEFGFATNFAHATAKEAENLDETISTEKGRKDLRDVITFTIDPKTAKDFDDALSFEKNKEGFIIGVHIADVSHFVKEGSALDKEAAERATSVYLVDRTIPMLPEKLSNNLCSLRPNEDRLAFSILFNCSIEGEVRDFEITKSIIHSDHRFAYEEAQEIIEGKADKKFEEAVLTCNQFAKKFRKIRFEEGAINFETPEVRFVLDKTGKPIGLSTKERKEAHMLIEEWMLLANKTVAKFMKQQAGKFGFPFIYRAHEAPSFEKLMDLKLFAKKFGYTVNIDNNTVLARDINKLVKAIEGKPEEYLLNNLAIRSMAKAIYTTQKSSHFGLSFDFYSHFTSPIRRYPDLLCHRYLHLFLTEKKGGKQDFMEALAQHSSTMEQKASEAERASIKYKQAEFLESQIGENFKAVVSGLTDWGMFALIPEFNAEGMVRISEIAFGDFYFDEKSRSLKCKKSGRVIQMGDEITVKVAAASPLERRIDLVLINEN